MTAPLPPNEELRLAVLRRYSVLDTPPEEQFDRITRVAARVFQTPIALISLVDETRQWFKSCFGVDTSQTDRRVAFCAYTILSREVLVVENALEDLRFRDNALVHGPLHIRFYAGAPLMTQEGVALGSLCIIDSVPRKFSQEDRRTLVDLAAMVVDELELRERTAHMAAEIARRESVETQLLSARAELNDANRELRASKEQLGALLNNAPAIIYSKDLQGRLIFVNRPFCQMMGKSESEIIGYTDHELFPAALADRYKANDVEIVTSNKAMEFEETVEIDGEARVFRSVKFPLRNASGETYALCGMSMDITQPKKAEMALREVDARKAAILEAALDGILTVDHNGHIIEVNSAVERIFGYSAEQMLGREMAELIVPERLREAHRAGLRRAVNGGADHVMGKLLELPGVRADGAEFPLELAITRIPLEGKPMFTGHIRDITARKQAQAALEESQARYERMAANMPGMVYQFVLQADGNSRFIFVSEGARELLKAEPAALLERSEEWDEKLYPEDLPALKESILESARDLMPWNWEGRLRLTSGDPVWVKALARPKREPNGDTVWDGFIFDITERKRSEEALRKSRDEAERANRAKSEFLSRMSHELRTPLNAILGFGQLLERAKLERRQAESVAQIIKAGRHLLGLINEVLDLSRIEAGRMTFSPEAVNATELISEVTLLIKPLCEERGIQVIKQLDKDYWVTADRQRLRQVLLNVLSNAVKYNKLAGTVEVRCAVDNLKRVAIAITDTGFGIPADQLENLFVPFERLGAEIRGIEGCGIGLALTKRLLDIMGGTLHVESKVQQGSTFTLRLPMRDEPQEPATALMELCTTREETTAGGVQYPVLYIEDNPANLRLMERIVEERGDVLLYSCERGDDALGLIRTCKPRLVLLDLHLPGLDGDKVLSHIRRMPEFRETPVVIVSADAMSSQIRHLLAAGASEYITKPIDIGEVFRLFDKYLN